MTIKKLIGAPVAIALAALLAFAPASTFAAAALFVGSTPVVVTQNGTAATPNVTFSTVRLSATSSTEDINVSRITASLSTGNGASPSNLNNCRAVNLTNGANLNSLSNIPAFITSGSNVLIFDAPLRITAGNFVDVAVRCDILASNAVGNTYAFTVDPAGVTATSAVTGSTVFPVAGAGVPTPPVTVVTTTTPGSVIIPPVVIPGLPNTGMGGSASATAGIILASLVVASLGVVYSRKVAR